ncbi:DNA-binding transcriptional regulator, XRE family [Pseudobutyrivibrio sp. OR37]|uniref:helix-turn-helix domain-containing protein n=1 Tax=Pseudobutyrivibrio sp. OR37 TaxID=1798186 RepID=UPI0008E3B2E1|nr:helix-turn-helix transcriptional regulator [Pseudobutyrivibrio sp. OR37]SFH76226.1 DNA-binding transcriptional regulator, XRE family [Pseudobutyrivibrio sp. OR37]
MITFDPLWKTLKEKDISQYDLINKYNVDKAVLQRLRNNHNVQLNTIDKLCNILNCNVEDIIRHK